MSIVLLIQFQWQTIQNDVPRELYKSIKENVFRVVQLRTHCAAEEALIINQAVSLARKLNVS